MIQPSPTAGGARERPVVEDITEARETPAADAGPAAAVAGPPAFLSAPAPSPAGSPAAVPARATPAEPRGLVAPPSAAFFERLGGGVAAGVGLAAALASAGALAAVGIAGALGFAVASVLVVAAGLVVLLVFLAAALRQAAVRVAWVGGDAHIHASVRRTPLPGNVAALAAEDQRLRGLLERQRAAVHQELRGQREELEHLSARLDDSHAARIQQEFRDLAQRMEKEGEAVAARAQDRAAAVTREMGERLEALLADARSKRAAIHTEVQDLEKLRAALARDREALAGSQRAQATRLEGAWQRFQADSNAAARRNAEAWQAEMRARIAELDRAIRELQEERAAIQAERAAWAGELRQRVEATVPEVVPPVVRQSVGRALSEAFSSRRFYLLLGGSLVLGLAVIVAAALLGVRNLGIVTPETAFMTGGLAVGLVSLVLLVLLVSLGGALRKLVQMAA